MANSPTTVLPEPVGRSDQHAAPLLDLVAGAELEVVEREVVEGAEVVDDGMVAVCFMCAAYRSDGDRSSVLTAPTLRNRRSSVLQA